MRGHRAYLGYRCAHSGMTLACAVEHQVESEGDARVDTEADDDRSKTIIHTRMSPGQTLKVTKFAAFHSSRGVPADELADRCARTSTAASSGAHRAWPPISDAGSTTSGPAPTSR
nr:hypothetical protein [Candidatus Microthrix sp.]